MSVNTVHFDKILTLECGRELKKTDICYHSYGNLNEERNNVIWVCHALTANSDVEAWWPGMVGPGALFDTDRFFVICANILGSCYGTTGPASVDPDTGHRYNGSFPLVTVRDMVRAHQLLREYLNMKEIYMITGGSLGGQQALEWAVMEPGLFRYLVPVATNAAASPWGIAFNESQRMALEADPSFATNGENAGAAGMSAARSIALLSYRNGQTYNKTQADNDDSLLEGFRACSYQRYQGEKLVKRFNPNSYYTLTKTLDSNNLGRKRGGVEKALATVRAKTLAVGITSDLLFPTVEQKRIAAGIPGAEYAEIDSFYGHDGFLLEVEKITRVVRNFLKKHDDEIQD